MQHAIRISCQRSNLKIVRDFVTGYLAAANTSEIRTNQIVLAVDEIVANLIIHANAEDPAQFLDVQLTTQHHQLLIELRDQAAASYSPTSYAEPDWQEYVRERRKGGMGMTLVNRIMDKVEFTHQDGFNICRLYKQLD